MAIRAHLRSAAGRQRGREAAGTILTILVIHAKSLNPCSNGMWSEPYLRQEMMNNILRLNPCSNGML